MFLATEDIDHSKTKARHPQTNGFVERFHKTMKNEFYDIAFRKKIYTTIEELQIDVNEWLKFYNEQRPHSGRYCYGKTPMKTFEYSKHIAQEKTISEHIIASSVRMAATEEKTLSHLVGDKDKVLSDGAISDSPNINGQCVR